jgi:hypothetical protein
VLDLDAERSAKVAADIGNQFGVPAFGHAVDVTSEESVAAAHQAVAEEVAAGHLPPVGALANPTEPRSSWCRRETDRGQRSRHAWCVSQR